MIGLTQDQATQLQSAMTDAESISMPQQAYAALRRWLVFLKTYRDLGKTETYHNKRKCIVYIQAKKKRLNDIREAYPGTAWKPSACFKSRALIEKGSEAA
jgi:hypothetical protein